MHEYEMITQDKTESHCNLSIDGWKCWQRFTMYVIWWKSLIVFSRSKSEIVKFYCFYATVKILHFRDILDLPLALTIQHLTLFVEKN